MSRHDDIPSYFADPYLHLEAALSLAEAMLHPHNPPSAYYPMVPGARAAMLIGCYLSCFRSISFNGWWLTRELKIPE